MTTPAPNTPAIRFRGFTEPWEKQALPSMFDFNIAHYSHSRDNLNYDDGEVYNIHYGDILILFGEIVMAGKSRIPFINGAKADDFKKNRLHDGDIIFADTAEDETCGKAIEIQDVGENTIVSGLHTLVARPKCKFASKFLGYYFNSNTYHDQLVPLMQGIKVLSINKASLENTSIYYPNNEEEQRMIGDFFYSQDEAISSSKEQIAKLKTIKQACLQQMFA